MKIGEITDWMDKTMDTLLSGNYKDLTMYQALFLFLLLICVLNLVYMVLKFIFKPFEDISNRYNDYDD